MPVRKPTRGQASVTQALDEHGGFVSAQDLHATMRAAGDPIGLATVYRALQAMVDGGELDVIRDAEGLNLYRRCERAEHHHHLVCRVCGRTEDVQAAGFEAWATAEAARFGFTDLDHTVELFGTCGACV